MSIIFDGSRLIGFDSEALAQDLLQNAKSIASKYGDVTKADVCDLVGIISKYEDNKVGWHAFGIDNAYVAYSTSNSWHIVFPPMVNLREPQNTVDTPEPNKPHPIYLNITTSDMDDPDCLICSVLTHAQKIRDRDIFINVY